MAKKPSKTETFKELTWNDIQEWAGTKIVSRGRNYQRNQHVQELALTPKEGVVAWVEGTQRYATMVDIDEGELTSTCTCPYWDTCKHAVAVVLEYLEHLKRKKKVPTVLEQDQRLALLQEASDEEVGADRFAPVQSIKPDVDVLYDSLERQTKAQLIALLKDLIGTFPIVREAIQDRRDLSVGTVSELVDTMEAEIDRLSAEPGWTSHWSDEGYVPDYSRVRDRLETLLEKGYADEVVTAGQKLLESGIKQIEMSHDDGETAEEISSCLDVVFRALSQSSLSPAEQMLWAVKAELKDEYDLCQGAEVFWEQEHTAADWNILVKKLTQRLERYKSTKGDDSFSSRYHHDLLSNWLIKALEGAGREEEIIPLCEREIEQTKSYVRFVNYLRAAGRMEEAEHWIHKGIQSTQRKLPGIANELRTALREMREQEKDWLGVAAFRAEDFFIQPTLDTFQELQKSAERAGVWPAVRTAAMHYLETGVLPQITERAKKNQANSLWPLPDTGIGQTDEQRQRQFPITETLIDIALAEKRLDDVIRWYDHHQRRSESIGWWWNAIQDDMVAKALAGVYPNRAIAIWKKIAENYIAQAQRKAYETAASYLAKIHRILQKLGREKEWRSYLNELREANARKRRLLEILDSFSGRPIIEE